jgi:hypothetical protein
MRAGQPHVQGHQARLEPEADHAEREERRGEPARAVGQRACPECRRSLRAAEQREEAEQAEGARVGRHEVDPGGPPHLVALLLGSDQEEGRERHQLPREQEDDRVASQHHCHHRARHHPPTEPQAAGAVGMLLRAPVAGAVEGAERRNHEHRHEE